MKEMRNFLFCAYAITVISLMVILPASLASSGYEPTFAILFELSIFYMTQVVLVPYLLATACRSIVQNMDNKETQRAISKYYRERDMPTTEVQVLRPIPEIPFVAPIQAPIPGYLENERKDDGAAEQIV